MSAVPIPQLHYRRMRVSDLPEVARLEKSLYTFPWSIGNFRDSVTAGYDCWTVSHGDRKSTRLNSSHIQKSRMPSSA